MCTCKEEQNDPQNVEKRPGGVCGMNGSSSEVRLVISCSPHEVGSDL